MPPAAAIFGKAKQECLCMAPVSDVPDEARARNTICSRNDAPKVLFPVPKGHLGTLSRLHPPALFGKSAIYGGPTQTITHLRIHSVTHCQAIAIPQAVCKRTVVSRLERRKMHIVQATAYAGRISSSESKKVLATYPAASSGSLSEIIRLTP